jgi:hypothetical protein
MNEIAIITTCTSRKRAPVPDVMLARNLPISGITEVAKEWTTRLKAAEPIIQARDLYSGRTFREAANVAGRVGAKLMIISAGYGLISDGHKMSPYGLTITPHSDDSVSKRLTSIKFNPPDWWKALNQEFGLTSPISDAIRRAPKMTFIIALSGSYLKLIKNDLLLLDNEEIQRVRLTGLRPSERIPQRLIQVTLPYDDRLDGPDSPIPGTRGDFAQRSLRHFVDEIFLANPQGLPEIHRHAVSSSLKDLRRPQKFNRTPMSDDDLVKLIRENLSVVNGKSAKMLRHLRDNLQIACEQKRFQGLFHRAVGDFF